MTLTTPLFEKNLKGPVGTILQSMHAKFEVRIFSHFGALAFNPSKFTGLRDSGNFEFLARDSIYAIARSLLTPVRLSVRPSVCHTGGSVKDGYS